MATRIPSIDAARCSGCGRCIAACHLPLFAFEQQGWRKVSTLQDSARCTGCAKCVAVCPIDAITMKQKDGPVRGGLRQRPGDLGDLQAMAVS